ncbi:MAG TPA: transglycosylase domain-containing protein [Ktedonobacteraceae bacterium]|nr:transglycosylase domain-containing protein [Ktedonobacteraceae bacterium]
MSKYIPDDSHAQNRYSAAHTHQQTYIGKSNAPRHMSYTNGGRQQVGMGWQQDSKLAPIETKHIPPARPNQLNDITARRMRINRILMRKRHHERYGRTFSPLTTIAFLVLLLFFISTSSGAGGAYAYYRAQLPLLNGIAQHSLFQTTHIYDRNGKLLYSLYDRHRTDRGRRTYVDYQDISPFVVNATIGAEDHSFWTNNGVDYYGITRAAVSNIQNQSIVEGGSTITQQLIKNQFFVREPRSFQVKGEEAILATGLTQQYPKWKIMEMYLNTVFYGNSNYGIEAAAQDYFGLKPQCTAQHCKPAAAQLTLGQASLLAGLPQSPTSYQPITNKTRALERQAQVLQSMVDLNMITAQQKQAAQKEMANYKFVSHSDQQPTLAPHFVDYVIDNVLIPLLGAQNLYDGGYNIYTTLDLDLEENVERIVHDHLYKPQYDNYLGYYGPLYRTNNVNNGAAVVMDPKTGEVLAMDGSVDYHDDTPAVRGQDNVAISLSRQPGSSFKPIVYATAFEMGWYPAMIVPDHPTYFPYPSDNKPYYSPKNYDRLYHMGFPMTVREAIGNSYNIPAVDAMEFAGHTNVMNMAGRLGVSEIANQPLSNVGPSMALGANPVSLLHLTGAYATFANRGVRMPLTVIREITDNQRRPLYTFDAKQQQGVRAMREDVAFLISSILSDKRARYHEFYPGNPLELDRPVAAKTGTTENFRDNWTMGYTPHLAVGVWAGNSDNTQMVNVIGITGAAPIWHDIMEYASQYYNFPKDDFVKPDDVHAGVVSALTGLLPHPGEPTIADWFIDGTEPTIQGEYYVPPPTPTPCQGDSCNQNGQGDQNGQDNQGNGDNGGNQDNGGGTQGGQSGQGGSGNKHHTHTH